MAFLIASAPFVLLVMLLNAVLYGHPFQSGYGQVADLFGLKEAFLVAGAMGVLMPLLTARLKLVEQLDAAGGPATP